MPHNYERFEGITILTIYTFQNVLNLYKLKTERPINTNKYTIVIIGEEFVTHLSIKEVKQIKTSINI